MRAFHHYSLWLGIVFQRICQLLGFRQGGLCGTYPGLRMLSSSMGSKSGRRNRIILCSLIMLISLSPLINISPPTKAMQYSKDGNKSVITWPLSSFGDVYARCKPKQKITSPDSDPIIFEHSEKPCAVSARFLLFPKGLHPSGDDSPILGGVMFKLVEGMGDGGHAFQFTVSLTVLEGVVAMGEFSDSGEVVLEGGQFSTPSSVEFGFLGSIPETASAVLTLKLWIKRDDLLGDDLLGDVRLGFTSIASSMYGFVSQSPAAVRPSEDAVDVPQLPTSSLDDLVTVVLDTPEGWSGDDWAVLVHICAAVVASREEAGTSTTRYQTTISDEIKGDLFRLCPPLRTHFQELAHAPHLQGVLVKGLVGALQNFSSLETPSTRLASLNDLVEDVGRTDELSEMETIYKFVLDPYNIAAGSARFKESALSQIESFRSDVMEATDILDAEVNNAAYKALIEKRLANLQDIQRDALTANTALRERVRYIIEYAGWGTAAVSGLRSALEVASVSPLDCAIGAAKALLAVL